MGDDNRYLLDRADENYIGVGMGYTMEDWTFAANWGKYTEDPPITHKRAQSGYAVVVNCDLGGGAEVQLGYAKSDCEIEVTSLGSRIFSPVTKIDECPRQSVGDSPENYRRITFGLAMNF